MGADRKLTADPQVQHQVLLEGGSGGREYCSSQIAGAASWARWWLRLLLPLLLQQQAEVVQLLYTGGQPGRDGGSGGGTENSVTRSSQGSRCCTEELLSLFTVPQTAVVKRYHTVFVLIASHQMVWRQAWL